MPSAEQPKEINFKLREQILFTQQKDFRHPATKQH